MYRLTYFGNTNLEFYNQVDSIGSGATPANYQALPDGGALDNYGAVAKHPGVVERVKTMRLQASSEAGLEAIFFGLMALRGTRDRLYRRTSQGDVHWVTARLTEIVASRDYQLTQYKFIQDVEMHFMCQDAFWYGAPSWMWYLDDGYYLNQGYHIGSDEPHALTASPCSFTVSGSASSDAGRAPVRGVKITVTAGNAGMSNITIARSGGESLTYTGTIPSGGTLVINTATMQVSCTGVSNAYNNLTFSATADMAAWFTLQPGDNPITVTYTGGGAGKQIEFDYVEAWY